MTETISDAVAAAESYLCGESGQERTSFTGLAAELGEIGTSDVPALAYLAVLLDRIGCLDESLQVVRYGYSELADRSKQAQAELRNVEGVLAASHGDYRSARAAFSEAFALADEASDLRSRILMNRAAVHLYSGHPDKTRAEIAEIRAGELQVPPAVDLAIATAEAEAARAVGDVEGLRDAAGALRAAVRRRIAELGPGHPLSVLVTADLAAVELDLARAEGSRSRLQDIAEVLEALCCRLAAEQGAEHPRTLAALANFASAQADLAIWDGARRQLVQAAESLSDISGRMEAVLGADHPQSLATEASLATVRLKLAQAEQSPAEIRDAMTGLAGTASRMSGLLGSGHPSTLHARAIVSAAADRLMIGAVAGRSPRVFVSYAHDDIRHVEAVRAFCEFLAADCGLEVHMDRWDPGIRQDWYLWALDQVTSAAFVLVIASPMCRLIGDGHISSEDYSGIQAELPLIRELVYTAPAKLLPVVLPGGSADEIPAFLQLQAGECFLVTEFTVAGAEELLRHLTAAGTRIASAATRPSDLPLEPFVPEQVDAAGVRTQIDRALAAFMRNQSDEADVHSVDNMIDALADQWVQDVTTQHAQYMATAASAVRAAAGPPLAHQAELTVASETLSREIAGRRALAEDLKQATRAFAGHSNLPDVDRLDALVMATELFARIYPMAPQVVPGSLLAACRAISAGPEDKAYVPLHDEAIDLLDEASWSRDQAITDQAVWMLAVAVLGAKDDPLLPGYLSHLGTAWADRFQLTGRPADLDKAIAAHRTALELPVLGIADQAGFRANYAMALRIRYEVTGNPGDMDEAIAVARRATEIAGTARTTRHDEDQSGIGLALRVSLQNLAATLVGRFQLSHEQADLDEAIDAARAAIGVTDPDNPGYPVAQTLLANALLERFDRFWDAADLSDAVASARAGVGAVPAGGPIRASAVSALAAAYSSMFKHTGDVRDLDRAIAAGRESVAAAQGDLLGSAICLSNLGGILTARWDRGGDTDALDEAVEAYRLAARSAPDSYVNRPGLLHRLGNALRSRFLITGSPADIGEAIEVLSEAVSTAPATWLDRPGYVADLAEVLIMAAERHTGPGGPNPADPTGSGQPAALGQAATLARIELEAITSAHPLRHLCLAAAGHAWLALSDLTGDVDALEHAIDHWTQAANLVSAGHPLRADYLTALGAAWLRKFDRSRRCDQDAGAAAMRASKSAASIPTATALTRALAARNWGEAAAGLDNIREAASGFATAVDLLDQVAWRGLPRDDQERQIGRFSGLACDAAAWAIEAGNAERAAELLEQGRGVLLARALADRSRQHDLLRDAPDLAAQLASVDDLLESMPSEADLVLASAEEAAIQRKELTRLREEILVRIREMPGYSSFLRAPRFDDLRAAAQQGPVVLVNVSSYRCDALVVTADGIQVIPLPRLTEADVTRHASDFLTALEAMHQADATPAKLRAGRDTVTATLRWLWEGIVMPIMPSVLEACTSEPGHRPRVWWCPTGPLTFLPLHAAGMHDSDGGESTLSYVASSYTLSLLMLQRARERPHRSGPGALPIVVALPETPGRPDLPAARAEADIVTTRFPRARRFLGAQATVSAVSTALKQSPPLAHFACHSTQDIADPSSAHLALFDGRLSIGNVTQMRLNEAELAFLSASETCRGGVDLPDEGITAAAAFQVAGYRHVIGTLWDIDDELAPAIAEHVYRALTHDGTTDLDADGTAAALDSAILAVRTMSPLAWAAYIHMGP